MKPFRPDLFIVLISLAAFTGCTKSPESFSEDLHQYLLVYNVGMNSETDDYDVWTIDPISKEANNITQHPDVAWTYSTINEDILFISDRDTCSRCYYLYRMNGFGQNISKISNYRLRDSWMNTRFNGTEIIISSHRTIDSIFLVIDTMGNIVSRIPAGLPSASDPAFSPDGSLIAFRGGTKRSKREEGYEEAIYRMNANGSNMQKLTSYPAQDTSAPWYAYKAGPPKWHPSGQYITFQSFQNGKYSLYAVSRTGTRQWKLTDLDWEEGWHEWSPKGRFLAIEVFDKNEEQFHIGLLDWGSKEFTILTDTIYQYQQAPVFLRK